MKIGIIGKGRMGSLIKETAESKGIETAAMADAFDKEPLLDNLDEIDVILDFSHPDNLSWVLEAIKGRKTALVEGTTAYSDEQKAMLVKASKDNPIFFAANYSLGIAVLQKLLKTAVPALKDDFDIEIMETHHNQKADAPSGTAMAILETIDPENEYEHVFGRNGITGKRKKEIGIHALRGGSVPGDHTVYFLGPDERLEISHSANSRQIFVNGAIKAAQFVKDQPAGLYSMGDLVQ